MVPHLHPHFMAPYAGSGPAFVLPGNAPHLPHPQFAHPQFHASMMPTIGIPINPYAPPPMAAQPSPPPPKTPPSSKLAPPKGSSLRAAATPFIPATMRSAAPPQQPPPSYPPPSQQPHHRPQPNGRTPLPPHHFDPNPTQPHRRDRGERSADPNGFRGKRGLREGREPPYPERPALGRQQQQQPGKLEVPPHLQPHASYPHPKGHKQQQQLQQQQQPEPRHLYPSHPQHPPFPNPPQHSFPAPPAPPLDPAVPPAPTSAPAAAAASLDTQPATAPAAPATPSAAAATTTATDSAASSAAPSTVGPPPPSLPSTDRTVSEPPTAASADLLPTTAPVAPAAAPPPPPTPSQTATHPSSPADAAPSPPPAPSSKSAAAEQATATAPAPTPTPSTASPLPPSTDSPRAAPPARSTPSWSSIAKPKDAPAPPPAVSSPRALPPDVPTPTPPSQTTTRASDTWKQRLQSSTAPKPASTPPPALDGAKAAQPQQPRAQPQPRPQQPQQADGRESPTQGRARASGGKQSRRADDAAALLLPPSRGPVKVLRIGGVTFEGLDERVRQLRLVRGLINNEGQYNCFLNVIIQSLWHIRCFREAIARVPLAAVELRGGPQADVSVLKAVCSIFRALSEEPTETEVQEAPAGGPEDSAAEQAALRDLTSKGWVVDAAQLREALSGLDKSQAAIAIQMSEMHDASEVLGEVFNCLHRAELGRTLDGANDLQLPQRVMVRKDPSAVANGVAKPAHAHGNGNSPSAGAAGSAANGVVPKSQLPQTRSFVHQLFGLDVQVACPPSDDEDEGDKPARRSRAKQQAAAAAAAAAAPVAVASPAVAKKAKDPNMSEVQQYMKYFHLVPAQGLRQAHDTLFDCSFEEVLREADAAETLQQRLTSSGGGPQAPSVALLRGPRVFTLAIVWESPQAPLDAIKGTVSALGVQLDLAAIYTGSSRPQKYSLRSVVCYFGHHYQSFALSEELQQWLLFDDTAVKLIGSWQDVARTMISSRLQPSLLFYEACSPST